MVSVDRSREFQQLCAQLGPSMPPTPPPAAATPAVASLSDFHSAASNISHEIYNTSQKLAQLTRLVQQRGKSLFNDPANEISALVHFNVSSMGFGGRGGKTMLSWPDELRTAFSFCERFSTSLLFRLLLFLSMYTYQGMLVCADVLK